MLFTRSPILSTLAHKNATIDKLIAFATWGINLAGPETTERLQGIRITADAFDILGAKAVAGRILQSVRREAGERTSGDDQRGTVAKEIRPRSKDNRPDASTKR